MFWTEIWKISEFLSDNFQFFLVVKFSIYLNRRVFCNAFARRHIFALLGLYIVCHCTELFIITLPSFQYDLNNVEKDVNTNYHHYILFVRVICDIEDSYEMSSLFFCVKKNEKIQIVVCYSFAWHFKGCPLPPHGQIHQMTNWWCFSYFSINVGFDISCKLSPEETICMKCQNPFAAKNKKNISKCHLPNIHSTLSNKYHYALSPPPPPPLHLRERGHIAFCEDPIGVTLFCLHNI